MAEEAKIESYLRGRTTGKISATDRAQNLLTEVTSLISRASILRDRINGVNQNPTDRTPEVPAAGLHPALAGLEKKLSELGSLLSEIESLV
jgi:hypothetical protein